MTTHVLPDPELPLFPLRTVLFPDGFDSTCEEMYKYGAQAALAMANGTRNAIPSNSDARSVFMVSSARVLGHPGVGADGLASFSPY